MPKKTQVKVRKGKDKGKAPMESPPAEEERADRDLEDYPLFVVDMTKLPRSYRDVMADIKAELKRRLQNESTIMINKKKVMRTIKGKLYTPQSGGFLVQLRPGLDSPPKSWVTLLFRWIDLYFESFHSQATWYRMNDAQLLLPQGPKFHGNFHFNSSHDSLGGYLKLTAGPDAFKKMYEHLLGAAVLIARGQGYKLHEGPLSLVAVAFAEALRFWILAVWIYKQHIAAQRCLWLVERNVPPRFTDYFSEWDKRSKTVAKSEAPKDVVHMLQVLKYNADVMTYDDVPSSSGNKQQQRRRQRLPWTRQVKPAQRLPCTRQVKPAPSPVPAPLMQPQLAQVQVPPTPTMSPVPVPGAVVQSPELLVPLLPDQAPLPPTPRRPPVVVAAPGAVPPAQLPSSHEGPATNLNDTMQAKDRSKLIEKLSKMLEVDTSRMDPREKELHVDAVTALEDELYGRDGTA